ncbi:unnamed protein product, partial [marine sediment metagenome]
LLLPYCLTDSLQDLMMELHIAGTNLVVGELITE